MSHCFISYRHVSPDQDLAHALSRSLVHSGHTVFLDSKIEVGTRWVDVIERELRAAQFFAVLLSEQSVRSDMVRQEVALAHQLSTEDKLCILPVRVGFTAALPYDLGAYLNPFQHSRWHPDEPFDSLCAEIAGAINHRAGVPQPPVHEAFDPNKLDGLTKELAVFLGPVARVLVNRAAKHAPDWKHLCDALAKEIPAEHERKIFLAKRAASG